MSYKEFQPDIKTQRAVSMNLVILGEAAAKIEDHFPDFVAAHPEIAWVGIRGMRNRIAHQYFTLNTETIWETIGSALPTLLQQVGSIMNAGPMV